MISFVEWMKLFNESSRGLKKGLRKRVLQFAPNIQNQQHSDLGIPVDYKSTTDARRDLGRAARQAQEINQQHPNGVIVYHSIVLGRGFRSLEDRLSFMMSKKRGEEQSVSVKKSLWDHNLVLVGTTRKLLYYWATDIHTKHVPGSPGMKIPLDASRPEDFRPYDEALVDLADVTWNTLFVNTENEKAIEFAGGMANLRLIAKKFGLQIKLPEQADPDRQSPLIHRHQAQKEIDKLVKYNQFLYDGIIQMASNAAKSQSLDFELKSFLKEIEDELNQYDVEQNDLVKYPAKRAIAMKNTFGNLKLLYQKVQSQFGSQGENHDS